MKSRYKYISNGTFHLDSLEYMHDYIMLPRFHPVSFNPQVIVVLYSLIVSVIGAITGRKVVELGKLKCLKNVFKRCFNVEKLSDHLVVGM